MKASVRVSGILVVAVTALSLASSCGALARSGSAALAVPASASSAAVGMSIATNVLTDPDGRVVVVGASGGDFTVARFTATGASDASFGGDGTVTSDIGADDIAYAVLRQPDGKIVVLGTNGGDFAVARYTSAGALDRTFSGDGKLTTSFGSSEDSIRAAALQPDGKIVAAGRGDDRYALARYRPSGALDTGFGHRGRVSLRRGWIADVIVQASGRIVVVGGYIIGLTSAGAVDPDFDSGGLGDGGEGWLRIVGQPDGRLVIGAATDCNTAAIARLMPTGAWDAPFYAHAGVSVGAAAIGVHRLSTGKLLLVSDGWAEGACGPRPAITIERYLPDGSKDTTFAPGGVTITDTSAWPADAASVSATRSALAPDGKIVVVGRTYVARFTSAGALDDTFSGDGIVPLS